MSSFAPRNVQFVEGTSESPSTTWVVKAAAEGRYRRIQAWNSRFLPVPRDLFVYLPEAYLLEPTRSFPMLVMHDGQNLFDGSLSYVTDSTWRVGATADQEIASGRVAPLVIVGVANAGVQRMAEYTPTPDRRLGGGKGRLYARLLVEEVIPLIRREYRILQGPEQMGIAGSSLGGLISLAIALRYSRVFHQVGVVSPSLWWDDRSILKDVRTLSEHLPLRIWLDMGAAEGLQHVRDANLMHHLLQARGWKDGVDLQYRLYPGALHNEEAWASRFGEMLRFLFPRA